MVLLGLTLEGENPRLCCSVLLLCTYLGGWVIIGFACLRVLNCDCCFHNLLSHVPRQLLLWYLILHRWRPLQQCKSLCLRNFDLSLLKAKLKWALHDPIFVDFARFIQHSLFPLEEGVPVVHQFFDLLAHHGEGPREIVGQELPHGHLHLSLQLLALSSPLLEISLLTQTLGIATLLLEFLKELGVHGETRQLLKHCLTLLTPELFPQSLEFLPQLSRVIAGPQARDGSAFSHEVVESTIDDIIVEILHRVVFRIELLEVLVGEYLLGSVWDVDLGEVAPALRVLIRGVKVQVAYHVLSELRLDLIQIVILDAVGDLEEPWDFEVKLLIAFVMLAVLVGLEEVRVSSSSAEVRLPSVARASGVQSLGLTEIGFLGFQGSEFDLAAILHVHRF